MTRDFEGNSLSYAAVPVRELRSFPIRQNPRLTVLDFRLTSAPGLISDKPRTYGHGAALLGGFILNICVVKHEGEWLLETSAEVWDKCCERQECLALSPQVLSDIYRAVQCRLLTSEGRAYGKGKGRN